MTVGFAVPLPVSALAIAWLSTTPTPWGGVVIAVVLAALGGLAGLIWAARTVRPDGRIAPSGVVGWAITFPLLGLPAIVIVWTATVVWDVAGRLPDGHDAELTLDANAWVVSATLAVVLYLVYVTLPALLITVPLAAVWARATRRRALAPACRMSPSATLGQVVTRSAGSFERGAVADRGQTSDWCDACHIARGNRRPRATSGTDHGRLAAVASPTATSDTAPVHNVPHRDV